MKKRLLLLLFVLLLCLTLAFAGAETEGDFLYTVQDGKAKITGYTGSASVLTVPDTLGGYPVTAIGAAAFKNCTALTELILPEGVTEIRRNAFEGCVALAGVQFPESLRRIDDYAFKACPSLAEMRFYDELEFANLYAFYGCSAIQYCSRSSKTAITFGNSAHIFTDPEYPPLSLMAFEDASGKRTFTVMDCDVSAESVSFPEGVTIIGNSAFAGCEALERVVIPDGVKSVGYAAFDRCAALTEAVFPMSVEKIDEKVFRGCENVTIIAPAGSAAQAYAEANGLAWRMP